MARRNAHEQEPVLNEESNGPFESIEGAQEYTRLLYAAVLEARRDVEADVVARKGLKPERRLQALQLVSYKLENLEKHLKTVLRTLNDLRTLRRLLLEDRAGMPQKPKTSAPEAETQDVDWAC
jgi:hypothetical protein